MEEKLITRREAAEKLGISEATYRRNPDRYPPIRQDGKKAMVRLANLEQFIRTGEREAPHA